MKYLSKLFWFFFPQLKSWSMSPIKIIKISHMRLSQKLVTEPKCLELWALKYYSVSLRAGYYDSPCPRKPHQLLDNTANNADYCVDAEPQSLQEKLEKHLDPLYHQHTDHRSYFFICHGSKGLAWEGRMQRLNLNTVPVIMGTATQELRAGMPGSPLRKV